MALRRTPPRALTAVVLPGERLLAWGRTDDGGPVGVTTRALYLPDAGAVVRVPHERIAAATWEDPDLVVTLVGPRATRYRLLLDDPGDVPPALRERVTASIVVSEHVDLDIGPAEGGGGSPAGARITARRPPGTDELAWNVVLDPGLDPSDPEVRASADRAIAVIRASTGV